MAAAAAAAATSATADDAAASAASPPAMPPPRRCRHSDAAAAEDRKPLVGGDGASNLSATLPQPQPYPYPHQITDDDHMAELAAAIKVGDRCEVNPGGKRGEAKFVGRIPAIAAGWLVG